MYNLIITYNIYETINNVSIKKINFNSLNECINYINKFKTIKDIYKIIKIEIINN